ncbi:MAG: nucleotidyltransferase family protein [Oscillospiraceae bacterium]|nr:nucleotidyltransferase family protein [Oscillospiraceae bacterium]
MAIYGIIAEYNPFHNGHLYQINAIKQSDPEAKIVVAMSPNVVQRGDFALFDKWTRARAALSCGADLVLEIPSTFALATAERFALGGVSVLDDIGVDRLCFGSESGNLEALKSAATLLDDEEVKEKLKGYLSEGNTFAKARNLAVKEKDLSAANCLETPNDILAVEYIKAISKLGAKIEAYPVLRKAVEHLEDRPNGEFASASFIRENLSEQTLADFTPSPAAELFGKAFAGGDYSNGLKSLETALVLKLRTMQKEQIAELYDVSEGLENRIWRAARECSDLDSLLAAIKTKRYTMARIRRILMYALLDFTKKKMTSELPNLRVLGHNAKGLEIISRKTAKKPIVTSLSKAKTISEEAHRFAEIEENVSSVFALTLENKELAKNEFSTPTIRI